jgi:hypothetical protein
MQGQASRNGMTGLPLFDGATFNRDRDENRLRRQLDAVRRSMLSGGWWTLAKLATAAQGSEASVSARLRDLRKQKFGAYDIERRYVANGVWEYHLKMGAGAP